jgi:hypothetical protein
MPGQAAGKSRSEVCAAMNRADISQQKKHGSGGDPVHCPNTHGNPSLGHSGKVFGKTNRIKIQGPKL